MNTAKAPARPAASDTRPERLPAPPAQAETSTAADEQPSVFR